MAWWQRQFGATTRGRLVAALRRGQRSVEELAEALDVTPNAVRAQLAILERDGVVESAGIRRDGAVGKPATLYAISRDSSALFSSAYAPMLGAVLRELGSRMPPEELESLLRDAGRRIAPELPPRATLDDRARASAAFLAGLGADAELVQTKAGYEIRGYGCPLSDAVSCCPATCAALEALLTQVTGVEVHEHCDRSDIPSCRFSIPAR